MNQVTLMDEILDPLALCLDSASAEKVAAYRLAPVVEDRLDVLGERANEGLLTADERSEYQALIDALDLISLLKLKARRRIPTNSAT